MISISTLRSSRRLILVLNMWFLFREAPVLAAADTSLVPGERLTYQIYWSFIPAARATLEIAPNGENSVKGAVYHFTMTARTLPVLDMIYKYRERIDSYVAAGVQYSLRYKRVQESSHPRDILVDFDWNKGRVQYRNFGKSSEPIRVRPGTLDPLSALYYIRSQPMTERFVFERWVTDGKKLSLAKASFVQKETLTIHGKNYQTIKVEPDLRDVKGVFEKSPGAKLFIWLTDDSRKLPVKVKSKVKVGSFIAELIEEESVIPSTSGQEDHLPAKSPR